ncbi:MAG: NAD-dependent succinate-semialdehyde dehydrogenase [Bacteroidales bacterium]|jgi:succinate-semialdehyde dehydrogenase/glutarate-semialdehyde dehydrogenase|nr:NAD-dependent succinate-semialdehyde dehydrogenase [Bacteroidales bacterium]
MMRSVNPVNNEMIREYPEHFPEDITVIIQSVHSAWELWKETSFDYRSRLFRNAALILRDKKNVYARQMTMEMGKLIRESVAEIEKCALVCDYYAEHAEAMLKDEDISSDARRSFVTFQPLGVILAVMPWNFPFWQVFRFAAPSLMAGNAAVLKHASNVPGCALAIEEIFQEAGFPADLFRTLMISSGAVEQVIADSNIAAVTLTGSEKAGSDVASLAGKHIKKTLLELGGSDPFIVLDDADLNAAVKTAVTARMINQGQSCIAAKRFIVTQSVVVHFENEMRNAFASLKTGDPMDPATHVAPLARPDIVDEIERQVNDSIAEGARLVIGGKRSDRPGCYFEPTILADVKRGMRVYHEETFGPVVAIIPVSGEAEAITVANDNEFGLGGCVWTKDLQRGEVVARKVVTGAMFVNGMTKSDPRLSFGGVKKSGYGRELGSIGIKEFVNAKTIWIG